MQELEIDSDIEIDGIAREDEYDEFVAVPKDIVFQAVAVTGYDAKRGYQGADTTYADIRHATGRILADALDTNYTDVPDAATGHDIDEYPSDD